MKLVTTTDQAELLFQQAETAREKARDEAALRKSRRSLSRSDQSCGLHFPPRTSGSRECSSTSMSSKKRMLQIDAARRARPSYAEASAVEGRIYREEAFDEEAIRSFRRAIQEAGGFQPEAHVGMAKV